MKEKAANSLLLIVFLFLSAQVSLAKDTTLDLFQNMLRIDETTFEAELSKSHSKVLFIMFYAPWCPYCKKLIPAWDRLALELKEKVTFAIVDCEESTHLKDRFSIMEYPTLILISRNLMFEYDQSDRDKDTLGEFATTGYLEHDPEEIPMSASQIKNAKKYISKILKRVWTIIISNPYQAITFAVVIFLFISGSIWVSEYFARKMEASQVTNSKMD